MPRAQRRPPPRLSGITKTTTIRFAQPPATVLAWLAHITGDLPNLSLSELRSLAPFSADFPDDPRNPAFVVDPEGRGLRHVGSSVIVRAILDQCLGPCLRHDPNVTAIVEPLSIRLRETLDGGCDARIVYAEEADPWVEMLRQDATSQSEASFPERSHTPANYDKVEHLYGNSVLVRQVVDCVTQRVRDGKRVNRGDVEVPLVTNEYTLRDRLKKLGTSWTEIKAYAEWRARQ